MEKLFVFLSRFDRREQIAILAVGLLVALYLLWMIALSPLQKKRDQMLSANIAVTQTLGRVQIAVAQIKQLRASGTSSNSGENINGIIDSSLRSNGLAMSGFQPGTGGEVRVRLDRAGYEQLMAWLYEIETQRGISIKDLSIAATNDPGVVTVNLRLQKAN